MNSGPKHTAKVVIKWLKDSKTNVLTWASQNLDLNIIENLWINLNECVSVRQHTNMSELHSSCQGK